MDLPLLTGNDRAYYPADARCPVCSADLNGDRGAAFLDGGALLFDKAERKSKDPKRLKAFLRCGFHGQNRRGTDSVNVEIVRDLERGQFEISFCSLSCLREWLNQLLNDLEAALIEKRPPTA